MIKRAMNSEIVIKKFHAAQNMLRLAAILQLTSHMWPKPLFIPDRAKYDYIIVGGGTAGCVIASRLVELKDVKILLIEAGGDPPLESSYQGFFPYLQNSEVDWKMRPLPEPSMRYHKKGVTEIPQGKMLGGTSSLNYMVYARGDTVDYALWATLMNDSSWSYDALLPYFERAEKLMDRYILKTPDYRNTYGKRGKIKLKKFYYKKTQKYLSAFQEMGNNIVTDINSVSPLGFSNVLLTCGNKMRQSTAYSYLRKVKNSKRLHVMTFATVSKIIFDEEKNAIGVTVRTKDENIITVLAKREIILTAGVFKTPQLLMLSGIGPKKHLNSKSIAVLVDLPVGKNLQDHPSVVSVFKMGVPKLMKTTLNLTSFAFPVVDGHVAINTSKNFPDYIVRSVLLDDPEIFLTFCAIVFNFVHDLCDRISQVLVGNQIFVALNYLPYPKSRGEVLLKSKNINDQPIIKLGLYSNPVDLVNHARFVKHFHSILNTTYFKRVGALLVDPNLKLCGKLKIHSLNYWKCYASAMVLTLHNTVGTCSMGSVVNTNLLVKRVRRLRIADASIIPTPIASPSVATVIMIAERAAEMIKKDYKINQQKCRVYNYVLFYYTTYKNHRSTYENTFLPVYYEKKTTSKFTFFQHQR